MKHIVLNIEGMTCSACSNGLEKYLNKQEGVDATINLVMATASINFDESKVTINDLNKYIKEAGFKSSGEILKSGNSKLSRYLIFFFSALAIFLIYIGMGDMINAPIPNILNKVSYPKVYVGILMTSSVLAMIWGFDILKNGIKNIIHRMPNMDSLIGVGVIVNFIFSLYNVASSNLDKLFFESVVMILLFVKIGRYIDKKNKAKAIDNIKNLVTLTPKQASIIIDGKEKIVTLNEIKKGDIVVCRPGEKIAVDGIILNGETHTDESFITGESKPVSKNKGDNCLAGSINYDGYIEYEAVNIGKDSSISHIVDLVVDATNTKAKVARIADTISGYFVPAIFVISILSFALNFFFTNNISASIEALVTVLVVACPCALGLATPLAMVVAIGNATKNGLIIKSSEIIENLNKINTVIFDKTGTLTKGKLEIVDFKVNDNYKPKKILKILEGLESKSNHPLARSIIKNKKIDVKVDKFMEMSGKGITGKIDNETYYAGNRKYLDTFHLKNKFIKDEELYTSKGESIIYLWSNKEILGIYGLRDEIKEGMKKTIKNLKDLNKKIIMLSGDNKITANIIADELSIDKVFSNMSPSDKVDKIKELNLNKNVLMVGDGINDSPALKSAAIGVSVSNGTDISNDAADVIMLSDDMNKLVELFKLGEKTIKIIKQNLFWALFYNMSMIPLATCLLPIKLNPMIASLAMIISSITVVLNSLRLKQTIKMPK